MTLDETYKKWEHLDEVLSSKDFCSSIPVWCLAYDLWQAVKEEMAEEKNRQYADKVMLPFY